jgi:hypothetical protein
MKWTARTGLIDRSSEKYALNSRQFGAEVRATPSLPLAFSDRSIGSP